MYKTVAVAAPVEPSSVPATKSANTSISVVPTSVASVSKVPCVVATALAHSGTSNDMMVSATSGAVTIANAAVDTMTYFQVMRDVSADSQTGDARLLGIKLYFTTDAANDA